MKVSLDHLVSNRFGGSMMRYRRHSLSRPAGWCDAIAPQWPVIGVVGEMVL